METAVEWLMRMLEGQKDEPFDYNEWEIAFKHALDMEKQHIVDSFEIGYENGACVNEGESIYHGHNYYKKTFKSE
jgi:hypothetical protein